MKKKGKITYRYFIYIFRGKESKKLLFKAAQKETILDKWFELKTQKPPLFLREIFGRKKQRLKNELVLVYPKNYRKKPLYSRDELGRLYEVKLNDDNFIIKEKIPYWEEEYIYDYETKKRIRFHELIDKLKTITEITQLYKLNNKLIVQNENQLFMFGNRNIYDSNRLYELLINYLTSKKIDNFLFSRDISTAQRSYLYDLLESKGISRKLLFKHYSY